MNLREGTRRLALLFGVVGAILGGVFSYAQLQSVMRQRADHRQFEQLAGSPVAQQARRSLEISCADGHTDNQCGDEQYVPMSRNRMGGNRIHSKLKVERPRDAPPIGLPARW